jgi:ribosomal protein S13
MKVDELAKSQDMTSKDVINVLNAIGIKNKKSTSKLNEKEVENVRQYISENMEKKPDVALIKKKTKPEEEEHKKIVIKKRR